MALIKSALKSGGAVSPQVVSGSVTPNATTDPKTVDLSSYDFTEIVGVVIDYTPTGYGRNVVASLDNAGTFVDVVVGTSVNSGQYSITIDNANKSVTIGYNITGIGDVTVPTSYKILVV